MPSVELPLGDTLRAFSDLSDIDYHEQLLLGGTGQATIEDRVFEKEIGLVEWINSLFPFLTVALGSLCFLGESFWFLWNQWFVRCYETSLSMEMDQRFGSVL